MRISDIHTIQWVWWKHEGSVTRSRVIDVDLQKSIVTIVFLGRKGVEMKDVSPDKLDPVVERASPSVV